MPRPRPLRPIRTLAAVLTLILAVWLARQVGFEGEDGADGGIRPDRLEASAPGAQSSNAPADDAADGERVARAFASGESGFGVTVSGEVVKLLPDDRDGSRHQRFLLRIDSGPTLLVAHNIDLAERAPIERGDRVRVRGQYEWNERGGVLHWTHRDPDGDHPGGFIESGGRRVD